jgi:cold shock CspA family protein
MSNYFDPKDVITADGVVSNITRAGAGFISTKDGTDIFVPVRIVESSGIEMGDSVTVYMIKNFGDPSLKNLSASASYRALRVNIKGRVGEDTPEPKAPVAVTPEPVATLPELLVMRQIDYLPKTEQPPVKLTFNSADLRKTVSLKILDGFIGTSAMMHRELVEDFPEMDLMGDDNGLRMKMDISSLLHRMHNENLIAHASICTSSDQKNSSYSVYGQTAKGLFNAIIGA